MKNFILIIAGAFLLLSACTKKVDIEAEKENVKAVIDQYTKVLKTEDLEMLSKITAHDADMVNLGTDTSERLVGWEALKELMQKQFEATETTALSVKDQVIKVHNSGKVAWFSEILDWVIIADEQEVKLTGVRVTGVLEKRDGNWIFVQVHYSVPVES